MVSHDFISQKLIKLQEAESLPFCPTHAAFFLEQCSLHSRVSMSYEFSWGERIQDYFRSCQKNYSQRSLKELYKGTIPDRRVHIQAVVRGGAEGALALPDFGVSEKRTERKIIFLHLEHVSRAAFTCFYVTDGLWQYLSCLPHSFTVS